MKENGLHRLLMEQEAPSGLFGLICERISVLERRLARVRAGVFGLITLVSAVALIPAVEYALQQFYVSGFYDYVSLLISDNALALTYWREFSLSLIESLPSLALLLLIPIVAVLIWSLRRTLQTARAAFA